MTVDTTPLVRLVPGAVLLDSGPDEAHLMLPNHNVTFVNDEVTRLVHAYVDVLAEPLSRDAATRAVRERCAASEELCDYVWDLLDRSGCLAPGAAETPGDPLLEFWSSQGRDPVETQARLATAPAAVVAPEPLAAEVVAALEACGVTTLPVRAERGDTTREIAGAVDDGAVMVACFGLPYGSAPARQVNAAGLDAGVPMLFGHVSGIVARIGPLVLPRATACLECTVLRMLAHAGAAEAKVLQALRRSSDGVPPSPPVHPAFRQATIALFALEASTISLSLPSATIGAVVELVQSDPGSHRRTVRRVPTCPECHPAQPQRFGWDATFRSPVLPGEGERP